MHSVMKKYELFLQTLRGKMRKHFKNLNVIRIASSSIQDMSILFNNVAHETLLATLLETLQITINNVRVGTCRHT